MPSKLRRVVPLSFEFVHLRNFTEHWNAIGSVIPFRRVSLPKCIYAVHEDIITILNAQDVDDVCRVYLRRVFWIHCVLIVFSQ